MKKRIFYLVIMIIVLICSTGCGSIAKELTCEKRASNIAKRYLKQKYGIDVTITYADAEMKNQTYIDGSGFGGEPTGPVEVSADYNGREIIVQTNCFKNTLPEDNIYSEEKLSNYLNCYEYDGIYFCEDPGIELSNYGEQDITYNYYGNQYDYSTQLTPSYKIDRTEERPYKYIQIFIPAYKLNTTFLENNRILFRNHYTSGSYQYETIDLHLTKDKYYYNGAYKLTPGIEDAIFTIIK